MKKLFGQILLYSSTGVPEYQGHLISHLPGSKGDAWNADSEVSFFSLFINDETVEKIILFTNEKISQMAVSYETPQLFTGPTKKIELLDILYFSGILRNLNLSLGDMYSSKYGSLILLSVMPKQ